ncbi:hypothetical protein [Desulfocapsa sulfexigens]|nr:hypothetical protein [Desulfocapsa sulfexigens]
MSVGIHKKMKMYPTNTSLVAGFHLSLIIVLYGLAFVVVFERPLDVQQWQWADDALFYDNARAIISNFGEDFWLGPFTEVLLAKAPFFSIFVALSISSGIPLRVLEFLLYVPLPFLFLFALRPLQLPKFFLLSISIVCLLFIPAAGLQLRLVRTTVFGAIVLYTLIFMTALIVYVAMRQKRIWIWAFLTGAGIGCAAMTREEGIWLFFPALIAMTAVFLFSRKQKRVIEVIVLTLLLVVGYQVPLATFSLLNYHSYGVFSPSLRQNQSYKKLYSTLTSIEPAERSKYVPFAAKARQSTYEISPYFRQLKPFVEGAAVDDLATNAEHHRISGWGEKLNTREFFVSTFDWALARAIFLSGRTTARDFLDFCDKATEEIQSAIHSGELVAGSTGLGLLPSLSEGEVSQVLYATYRSIQLLFWPQGIVRKNNLSTNPNPGVASNWHSSLGTWAADSHVLGERFSDIVFNRFVVNLFKVSYGITFVLGIIALVFLLRKEKRQGVILLAVMTASAGGVIAFSVVMGVMDTIAWSILEQVGSYNIIGQFPLHFLFLISVVAILHCFEVFRSEKLVTEKEISV